MVEQTLEQHPRRRKQNGKPGERHDAGRRNRHARAQEDPGRRERDQPVGRGPQDRGQARPDKLCKRLFRHQKNVWLPQLRHPVAGREKQHHQIQLYPQNDGEKKVRRKGVPFGRKALVQEKRTAKRGKKAGERRSAEQPEPAPAPDLAHLPVKKRVGAPAVPQPCAGHAHLSLGEEAFVPVSVVFLDLLLCLIHGFRALEHVLIIIRIASDQKENRKGQKARRQRRVSGGRRKIGRKAGEHRAFDPSHNRKHLKRRSTPGGGRRIRRVAERHKILQEHRDRYRRENPERGFCRTDPSGISVGKAVNQHGKRLRKQQHNRGPHDQQQHAAHPDGEMSGQRRGIAEQEKHQEQKGRDLLYQPIAEDQLG